MNRILYTLHIMWYESKMLNETLDSVQAAITNSTLPVEVLVCLNSQTYIEKPNGVIPVEMFSEFVEHPIMKQATFVYKTDADPFYNIGDWRRDIYGPDYDYKYIVWGESDCLVPEDHFYLLSNIEIEEPHFISLATRKMWDESWDEVEHPWIRVFPRNGIPPARKEQAPEPFNCGEYISLQQLNEFNRNFDPILIKLNKLKIDGNMTALSRNLPYPFLPADLHFAREDYCLELFFTKKQIPQYHISTRLKGHNQVHPKKRIGTLNQKNDAVYRQFEQEAYDSIFKFINNL